MGGLLAYGAIETGQSTLVRYVVLPLLHRHCLFRLHFDSDRAVRDLVNLHHWHRSRARHPGRVRGILCHGLSTPAIVTTTTTTNAAERRSPARRRRPPARHGRGERQRGQSRRRDGARIGGHPAPDPTGHRGELRAADGGQSLPQRAGMGLVQLGQAAPSVICHTPPVDTKSGGPGKAPPQGGGREGVRVGSRPPCLGQVGGGWLRQPGTVKRSPTVSDLSLHQPIRGCPRDGSRGRRAAETRSGPLTQHEEEISHVCYGHRYSFLATYARYFVIKCGQT